MAALGCLCQCKLEHWCGSEGTQPSCRMRSLVILGCAHPCGYSPDFRPLFPVALGSALERLWNFHGSGCGQEPKLLTSLVFELPKVLTRGTIMAPFIFFFYLCGCHWSPDLFYMVRMCHWTVTGL